MTGKPTIAIVTLAIAIGALASFVVGAEASKPRAGAYSGKVHPTDASDHSNDTKIAFKVDPRGRKLLRLKATFYYGCFIGGSFTLQRYVFPSVHKGPIRIRRNGKVAARDVIDKQTGFIVRFSGRLKGRRAKGRISLQTTTTGNGCGRDLVWSAKRR